MPAFATPRGRPALYLVRHPPVVRAFTGRCYGTLDPGLSRASLRQLPALVARLVRLRPGLVVHSGSARTRVLAEAVARAAGARLCADPRWRERDFGNWEGQRWARLHRTDPTVLDRLARDPRFRPGGGESTLALLARVRRALESLPRRGRVVVVAHGGSIALARAHLRGWPPERAALLIPAPGELVPMRLADRGARRSGRRPTTRAQRGAT